MRALIKPSAFGGYTRGRGSAERLTRSIEEAWYIAGFAVAFTGVRVLGRQLDDADVETLSSRLPRNDSHGVGVKRSFVRRHAVRDSA